MSLYVYTHTYIRIYLYIYIHIHIYDMSCALIMSCGPIAIETDILNLWHHRAERGAFPNRLPQRPKIRQHTSAYVSIRQHTLAERGCLPNRLP